MFQYTLFTSHYTGLSLAPDTLACDGWNAGFVLHTGGPDYKTRWKFKYYFIVSRATIAGVLNFMSTLYYTDSYSEKYAHTRSFTTIHQRLSSYLTPELSSVHRCLFI